jgi:hypothetical protein
MSEPNDEDRGITRFLLPLLSNTEINYESTVIAAYRERCVAAERARADAAEARVKELETLIAEGVSEAMHDEEAPHA